MTRTILYITLSLILVACNLTKNVPEGSYLLDDFKVKHDTENPTADLESFVKQWPNSSFPIFGKVRLGIYNMAGQDTSKWINRMIKKVGQPPVIYSKSQTMQSLNQLKKELSNQGYLNVEADTTLKIKGKKISVTYNLQGGTPYRIRNFEYAFSDTTMARIMKMIPRPPLLKAGEMYNMNLLEEERLQVNQIMRNVGYYNFSKEYLYYKADTTLNAHQVDLYMDVYELRDSMPHIRYKINDVKVISGLNSLQTSTDNDQIGNRWFFRNADTTEVKGVEIIRGRNNFLRNSTITRNNYLKKGSYFSDLQLNRTYEAYGKIGAIKQTNIDFSPSPEDSSKLDATIILIPANAHWFSASIDGTNSAGDLGVAPSISYHHQNLFNGGEMLNVKLKGAYEFISQSEISDLINQNYYEYGVETSLSFPMIIFPWLKSNWREVPSATTRFSIGLNNQHRPEYVRQFFNGTINYGWSSLRNRFRHNLDIIDINYIRMSNVSPLFEYLYLDDSSNPLLRESYRNQLVARTGYTFTLVNSRRFNSLHPTYALRGSFEIAGLLPALVASINREPKDEYGQRKILGVAYAEYIKGSIDYSRTFYFSHLHSLAYRGFLGMAQPFGNSDILPFERRFFAGGPNGIRGWSTRSLGPGSYKPVLKNGVGSDFVNQVGDMKLEMSIENRIKISKLFEFAQFIDAGNIWTLKNYKAQPGGQFKFNNFYKEIAVSYGAGLRLDLSFLILRFDLGVKAYDPSRDLGDRFILFKRPLKNMAFHFAIGYPF